MSNPLSRRNPTVMSDKTKAWLRKHNHGFAEAYRDLGSVRERSHAEAMRLWEATPPELRCDPQAGESRVRPAAEA